ncbi:winged helix-turn-helix transcriptional regulator [Streptomyces sp. CBMA29]|uniref:winged helix-turn-helix transcriptional regulator n=1 Tax=Streptomyces sp. CBMA29 TaxID=1896314 RepID=UPI001661CD67|nr:helix-turn-helix domain-containing protein [Streptomyces sp. CBMA29]MBD0738538.1 transcriptional regulator [Streptomyces sp. CBMA29]
MDVSCPERVILEHVTSRWGVLVLCELLDGAELRFSALRRAIGIVSEKMLTQTLRTLERDGFVLRRALPVIPPHVTYSLTPLGLEAAARVHALSVWTADAAPAVLSARTAYDAAHPSPS